MNSKPKHSTITDGTSQKDRFPVALSKGYINVDEMRFEDLLALGTDYASNLNFYNLRNQAEGTWAAFFTSDAVIIFSKILATDLKKFESRFVEVFLKTVEPDVEIRPGDVPTYQLAENIDSWLKNLRRTESETAEQLFLIIKSIIEDKLRKPLRALEQLLRGSFIEEEFDRIWLTSQSVETPSSDDRREYLEFLRSNFARFYNAVSLIQNSASELLPRALKSQIHSPAIGMYVAFLKLFGRVQHKLNRFTGRHLDFYYRDVLKVRPLTAHPDQTYLKFDTDLDDRRVLVQSGTEFTAGVDEENKDVIYTADNDLLVFKTRIEALKTLYFERDRLKAPEVYLDCVTGAKINEIPVNPPGDTDADKEAPAWPIFGAPRNAAENRILEDATLGFALSSPILLLKEGRRQIDITFNFSSVTADGRRSSENVISALIENIRAIEKPEVSEADESELKAVNAGLFFKVFRELFTIQLTAETGWHEIRDYLPLSRMVDRDYREDCLNLRIRMSPKDPPIVPYQAEIHGGVYDTDQPVVRLTVNPMSYVYPYTLMENIVIQEIEINVDVRDIRDIKAHNNLGQLDTKSPFQPFGPVPTMGSYFIVGSHEAAGKHLTRFEVDVEWAELPAATGGFKEYYEAYKNDYENEIFKAGVSVLNGGKWQPEDEKFHPRVKLFKAKKDRSGIESPESSDKRIPKACRLSGKGVVKFSRPLEEKIDPIEFGYDSSRKDGFFKFTLTGPDYAFGHQEYPLRLSQVLTHNSRLKKIRFHQPVPNSPYTPLINTISVNYRAAVSVNLEKMGAGDEIRLKGRIYHIHPFGVERLSPQTHPNITVVPRYQSDGNLFIGLSGPKVSGILTLLFHLRDDSTLKSNLSPPAIKWFYLSDNRWTALDADRVLSDSTRGFLSTGVVTLNIPEHPKRTNTTMAGDLFWLRASLDRNPEIPCSLHSIHTQAMRVTRQGPRDRSNNPDAILPAGTIKEARMSIPGIDQIVQVADSTGGSFPESKKQFITRISERLRHKNRATTPWDFERLILNQFPQIYKAKCFANMVDDPQNWKQPRPGHILIVVIPSLKDSSRADMKPTVNGLLLREIRDYVKRLASTFAAIKVRNPSYEKIQVRCQVRFRRDAADGYHRRRLNQAITDYLSPWNRIGYTARFGWCVRRHDLQSYIRSLEYIRFVTDFSMLRVAEDDRGYFTLSDSAAHQDKEIQPLNPWSIAIPFNRHYIETISKTEVKKPDITGIDELEIGSNFIIPGNQNHATER